MDRSALRQQFIEKLTQQVRDEVPRIVEATIAAIPGIVDGMLDASLGKPSAAAADKPAKRARKRRA